MRKNYRISSGALRRTTAEGRRLHDCQRNQEGFYLGGGNRDDAYVGRARGGRRTLPDLGIAAYLVKPVGLSELVEAVALALQRNVGDDRIPLVTRHFLKETKGAFKVRKS